MILGDGVGASLVSPVDGTCGEALLLSNFSCKGFFSNLFMIEGSITVRCSDLGNGARKILIRGSIMHFLISSS